MITLPSVTTKIENLKYRMFPKEFSSLSKSNEDKKHKNAKSQLGNPLYLTTNNQSQLRRVTLIKPGNAFLPENVRFIPINLDDCFSRFIYWFSLQKGLYVTK